MKGVLMIDMTDADKIITLVCVCKEPVCICVYIEHLKKDTWVIEVTVLMYLMIRSFSLPKTEEEKRKWKRNRILSAKAIQRGVTWKEW